MLKKNQNPLHYNDSFVPESPGKSQKLRLTMKCQGIFDRKSGNAKSYILYVLIGENLTKNSLSLTLKIYALFERFKI